MSEWVDDESCGKTVCGFFCSIREARLLEKYWVGVKEKCSMTSHVTSGYAFCYNPPTKYKVLARSTHWLAGRGSWPTSSTWWIGQRVNFYPKNNELTRPILVPQFRRQDPPRIIDILSAFALSNNSRFILLCQFLKEDLTKSQKGMVGRRVFGWEVEDAETPSRDRCAGWVWPDFEIEALD